MDNPNYSIEHRKGQHLTEKERHSIETHLTDGWSVYKIAKSLYRPYNTVKNEIARGTVLLYKGKVKRYKSSAGYAAYLQHRMSCRKRYQRLSVAEFIRYVERNFRKNGWSLNACAGRAIASGEFSRDMTVCTKTLYNYVDIRNYKTADALFMANLINGLPRKLFHYRTPDELFDRELDNIYTA